MAKRRVAKSVKLSVRLDESQLAVLKDLREALDWDDSKVLRWIVGCFGGLLAGSHTAASIRAMLADSKKALAARARAEHLDMSVRVAQRKIMAAAVPEKKMPEVVS